MHENIEHLLALKDSALHMSVEQRGKLFAYSVEVEAGLVGMYRYIQYRKLINEAFTHEDRRTLEADIRQEMAAIPLDSVENLRKWQELQLLHHCSVTADQAKLADAAFI